MSNFRLCYDSENAKNGFSASKNGRVVIFSRNMALNRKLLAKIGQNKAKSDQNGHFGPFQKKKTQKIFVFRPGNLENRKARIKLHKKNLNWHRQIGGI